MVHHVTSICGVLLVRCSTSFNWFSYHGTVQYTWFTLISNLKYFCYLLSWGSALCQYSWPLRIYPMRFAGAVADLMETMKASCQGQPEAPEKVPSALETFQMDWATTLDDELWQFTGIGDLFTYLRKNKKLQIPSEWKPFVPKTVGWASSLTMSKNTCINSQFGQAMSNQQGKLQWILVFDGVCMYSMIFWCRFTTFTRIC